MQTIATLFNHYGYIVLYVALALELIAFPLPGEVLMSYCGFLVFQGRLNWMICIIIAALGAISGVTLSYWIGLTFGTKFFQRFGAYIHMGPERIEKTSKWFDSYGNKLLAFAYFIPGIRHITGYFSGITKISFRRFALNAYLGALLWTGTFISLGKILGDNWDKFHGQIKTYLIIGSFILAIIMTIIYIYRKYSEKIILYFIELIERGMKIFHSLGRARFAVTGITVISILLFMLVIGLIQDYLSNEFKDFDTIGIMLVKSIFTEQWLGIFRILSKTLSIWLIVGATMLALLWIMVKSKDKFLEARFVIILVAGGEILEEVLRRIFQFVVPVRDFIGYRVNYAFPSEQTFMIIVIYGLLLYLLLRHSNSDLIKNTATFIIIGIGILSGISSVYLGIQYPSDMVSGFIFGGAWLGFNIVSLEIFRAMPNKNH